MTDEDSFSSPSALSPSSLAHASRGVARALSAPATIIRWLDEVITRDGASPFSTPTEDSERTSPVLTPPRYLAFAALSSATLSPGGQGEARSGPGGAAAAAEVAQQLQGQQQQQQQHPPPPLSTHDSALVVHVQAASVDALSEALARTDSSLVSAASWPVASPTTTTTTTTKGSGSGSAEDPFVAVRLTWRSAPGSRSGATPATGASGVETAANTQLEPLDASPQPPLDDALGLSSFTAGPALAATLLLESSGRNALNLLYLTAAAKRGHTISSSFLAEPLTSSSLTENVPAGTTRAAWARTRVSTWAQRLQEESSLEEGRTSSGTTQLDPTAAALTALAPSLPPPQLPTASLCEHLKEDPRVSELRVWFDFPSSLPAAPSASAAASAAAVEEGLLGSLSSRRPLPPPPPRHLDELGTYRGLCADGTVMGTDWVDVQPLGCNTWEACNALADCVNSDLAGSGCLCCALGENQAGYVRTDAEKAICACPAGTYGTSGICEDCDASSGFQGDCVTCTPGQFAAAAGTADACSWCAGGQYSSAAGASGCALCGAGTFSSASAGLNMTACVTCDAGTYSEAEASACSPCPAGTFAASSGAGSCVQCEAGKYASGTGNSDCTECDAGKYAASAASSCTDCAAGKYTATTGLSSCDACLAGTYASGTGNSGCEDCPAGTATGNSAQATCGDCAAGTFQVDTGQSACDSCPAGSYSSGTGAVACDSCSAGTYSAEGASGCTDCAAGKVAAGTGASSCSACWQGQYASAQGETSCSPCAAGTSTASLTGQASCTVCPQGFYAASMGSFSCTVCAIGYYAASTGQTSCELCGAGKYAASTEASACDSCAAGTTSVAGSSSCDACGVGTYAATTGSPSCDDCPGGTYMSGTGATVCSDCLAGQYSSAGSTGCTACYPGYYAASDQQSSCDSCPAGRYSGNFASSFCQDCAAGTNAPSSGSFSCTSCYPGYYSQAAATSCEVCPSGQYASTFGQSACTLCSAGWYSSFSEASYSCTACVGGFYAASAGSSSCDACSTGTYSSSGTTFCDPCEPGRYGPITASAFCSLCPAGKYSLEGSIQCTVCPKGQAAATEGLATCTNCTAGAYAAKTGRVTCTQCPGGQYQPYPGRTSCDDCEAGFFSSGPGNVTCAECPGGRTSSAGDAECENDCSAGTYLVGESCLDCGVGKFSYKGDFECTKCQFGRYAPDTATPNACTLSPAGWYVAKVGANSTNICPAGTFAGAGAYQCYPCLPGYFSTAGSASCDGTCQAGTYSTAGSFECTICPAGRYSDDAAASCSLCPCGMYTTGIGEPSCLSCPSGKYSFNYRTGCTNCPTGRYQVVQQNYCYCHWCPAGQYANVAGSSSCTSCEAGKWSGALASSCTSCLPGYYAPVANSIGCTVCALGHYAPALASSSCTICPAGKLSFTAEYECRDCPAGTYSDPGLSYCIYCNNGTYSSEAGTGVCSSCEPGRYAGGYGAFIECTKCPKGFSSDRNRSTSCDLCAAGQYARMTGQKECDLCSAGYYCQEGATKDKEHNCVNNTENKPEAFFCPVGSSQRVRVPDGWYSEPVTEISRRNRESVSKCSKTTTCLDGIEYSNFFWYTGDCAEGALDDSGRVAKTTVYVDEATDGLDVGSVQRVLSPFPVAFSLDSASNLANGGPFELVVIGNGTSFQIRVNMPPEGLDYETVNFYNIGLFAVSNGTTINCSMAVQVIDVNEKPTIVLGTPPVRNVSEAAIANEYLKGEPVQAEDQDTKDEHIYSIVASEPPEGLEYFGIGGCSGRVYCAVEGALDVLVQDEYNLTIRVKDDAPDPLQDFGNLTVRVLNANDPPYFLLEENQIHCEVDENSPWNTSVAGKNCSGGVPWDDPDLRFGDFVVWEISRNDIDDTFQIDQFTGELKVNRGVELDYEDQDQYSIEITMTDTGGLSASLDLIVYVLNVNEPPTTSYPALFEYETAAPGTVVCRASQVVTEDPDSTVFTYALLRDGNSTAFNITEDTGELTVSKKGLDFETQSSYVLTIVTTDNGLDDLGGDDKQSSTTKVHLTVLDVNEAPVLTAAEAYYVDEDAAQGSVVGYVYVDDPDEGQAHSFTLTRGSGLDFFTIAASTQVDNLGRGVLLVNSATELVTLDFETQPLLTFNVTTSDGALSDSATVLVHVNNSNDAPVCPDNVYTVIAEGEVGALRSYDFEQGVANGYEAAWNFTDEDAFSLGTQGWGQVEVSTSTASSGGQFEVSAACQEAGCPDRRARFELATALDYETTPTTSFSAVATDGGGLTCSTEVVITVTNVNDAPYFGKGQSNATFYVPDTVESGESVGLVTATDPDSSTTAFGTLTYSIFTPGSCPPGPNGSAVDVDSVGTLSVVASTGEILIDNSAGIVYPGQICTGLRVSDGGDPSLSATATVTVITVDQNSPPSLASQKIFVPEDTPSFTNLTRLRATDEDPGTGLTFAITSCLALYSRGNGTLPCGARVGMFSVVADGGDDDGSSSPVMSAWLRLDTSQLNYEDTVVFGSYRPPKFQLTVSVTDHPLLLTSLTTSATVTVVVTDVPEAPTFGSSSFSVLESADVGTSLGSVSGFAADEDAGASLTFSLDRRFTFGDAMTYDQCETFCSNNGLQPVCVDSASKQAELVEAYNGSLGNLWIGYRRTLDTDTPYYGEFLWESPGCVAGFTDWLEGYPTDVGSGATKRNCASMSLDEGSQWQDNQCSSKPGAGFTECVCEPGPFDILSNGTVVTTGTLDYESITAYTLAAVVTDDTGLSTEATVSVSVVDVPEAPIIYPGQVFTVDENTPRGSVIGQILAHDDDSDEILYELLNGTDVFSVSQGEGSLLAGGTDPGVTLDFECTNSYVLLVRATSDNQFVERVISVLIVDVNDVTVSSIQFGLGLSTLGGDAVSLYGTNFGPCGGDPFGVVSVVATYSNGLDGLTYHAANCTVSATENTLITCTAAPGVGSGHSWNVTVDATAAWFEGGRPATRAWGALSSSQTSYATPTVTSVTGASGMSTSGSGSSSSVTLTGTNFPPFACSSAAACGGSTSLAWQLSTPALDVAIRWEDSTWRSVGGDSSGGSFLDMACVSLAVTVGGTQAECVVGEGVGADLYWGVTVGASDVSSVALESGLAQFTGTGFAPPSVTLLSSGSGGGGASVYALGTAGGDAVLVTGVNFGVEFQGLANDIGVDGLSAPALVVTYGPAGSVGENAGPGDGGASKYSAFDCSVVGDHTEILCQTVPGVGGNLTWRVGVAGQWGSSLCVDGVDPSNSGDPGVDNCARNVSTSYAAPVVTPGSSGSQSELSLGNAVTGAGASGASTPGGQQLIIAGIEFGPSSEATAPVVTYGPSPWEVDKYSAVDCEVSVDYSQLRCLTNEGVGKDHWLQVVVGGQPSVPYQANISYSSPNVAEYSPSWELLASSDGSDGAKTQGGQWIVIRGRNFGSVAENALTEVRYQAATDGGAANEDFTETFYPCRAAAGSLFPHYSCPEEGSDSSSSGVASDGQPTTCLALTGVVSGPTTTAVGSSRADAIELYAACDVSDLSVYFLGRVADPTSSSGTSPDAAVPSSSFRFPEGDGASAGEFLYVASQQAGFEAFFGFSPDYSGVAAAHVDGDDALLLYRNTGFQAKLSSSGSDAFEAVVVDVFGTTDAAASDQGWAYEAGWASRRNGTAPDGSAFGGASSWRLGNANALSPFATNDAALAAGVGFSVGQYAPGSGWQPAEGCAWVDPCGCRVVEDHVAINCTTVPGAGSGHAWVVSVADQESTAATTSYGVPEVLALSGPGSANASTYGNQAVTLTGVNFGPTTGAGVYGNESFLESVTYGPGGTEYEAQRCAVTVGHTEIVCFTVAGVGPTLRWVVTVDEQASLASTPTTGYAAPQLLGVFAPYVSTEGGTRHVINGTDLGMASEDSFLQVFLDDLPLYVDGVSLATVFPASSTYMTSKATSEWAGSGGGGDGESSTSPYWEALEVVMPGLEDEDHYKEVVVVVGNRRFGGAQSESNTVVAQYKPPRLDEVQNSPGGQEGTQQVSDLILKGANFGSVGTVLLLGKPVDAGRIEKWRDDEITLSVVAESGNITVVVGQYKTTTIRFDDFSPILYTTLSGYLPDAEGYRTDALADAGVQASDFEDYADYVEAVNKGKPGTPRNLSLAGAYFGSIESVLEVTVGEAPFTAVCPIYPGSLQELPVVASEVVRAVKCQLPPGAGVLNPVVLSRSTKSSFVANASQQLYVDYLGPTVTGVEPKRVHTYGGGVVALSGRNFGTFARIGVHYGSLKIGVVADTFSATYMEVVVPEGDGPGRPLTVTVAGQSEVVYPSAEDAQAHGVDPTDPSFVEGFQYYAPNVSGIAVPVGGLSTLGGSVTLTGSDLGLSGSLKASFVSSSSSADESAERRNLRVRTTTTTTTSGSSSSSRGLASEYDPSEWVSLDYEVQVVNSTHDFAVLQIGQGQGSNELVVNVSGQVSLTPLAFAAPVLQRANPATAPTAGAANVTLNGLNFGLGDDFSLALTGAGDYCNHEWTEADVGTSVFAYSHSKLWFLSPEGQCDEDMELTLEVAGQLSNTLTFSFEPPTIAMLSLDGNTPLGSDCQRSSTKGCGLDTTGGYKVTVTGSNFGVADRAVLFRGVELSADEFEFVSHTEAWFVVPSGTGANIPVEVRVGARTSSPSSFSFDPPWVTSFTPNEFDANDDLIEIYGRNFGESVEDAGAISVVIGNRTCGPVTVGTAPTTIWQKTVNDVPYLWCHLQGSTVGRKDLKLVVAGQNLTRDELSAGIRGVCQSGYYGQEAWTVYTNSDVECEMECSASEVNGRSYGAGEQACTAFYDANSRSYRLEDPFTEESEECVDEWSCMRNADLATGLHSNCTILTRENEYCTECPIGSECDDFTTLYSVEPISVEGYWRDAVKEGDPFYPQFRCDPLRDHRPYCWDFQPCSPTEACKGNNECSKGYTRNKCSECCDVRLGHLSDGSRNPDCWTDSGDQLLYHRMYGKCQKCPDNMLFLVIGALVGVTIALLVGRRMQKKKVDLGIFSIGIDYFQVLAVFASTEVEWPESVQFLFRVFSLFNFSINLTPPECAFAVSYRVKWFVIEWAPTILFTLIALVYLGSRYYFRYCTSKSSRKAREIRNSMIAGSLLLMYVLYLNISENTLDPINCRKIVAEDGTKSDREFMVSQPAEVCWETRFPTMQQELAPYAFTFFFIYTVGYPLLVSYILLKPENREKCRNDQYLRCMGTGSRRETNKAYFNHRTKFATLYFKFKPKYYWWILLIVFRKLCIVSFTLLFHVNATMQLSMILLVIFLSYTAQIKYSPYLSRADYEDILGDMDEEEYQGLVGPYGTCPQPAGIGYDAMLEEKALKGEYAPTRVSVARVSNILQEKLKNGESISTDDLKAIGGLTLKILFDYNTVEAVLLFCAILVCLFGIMFASEFSGPGELLYERLGELTLAVIGVSLAYYFIVVWTEVVAVMFPSLELSFVSGAVDQKKDQAEYDEDGNVVDPSGKGGGKGRGGDGDGLEYDDSDEELVLNAASLGLDRDQRDDYVLRMLERDVVYQDTNPIVARAVAEELANKPKSSALDASEEKDVGPVLLGVEEQVKLQETVAKLMEEVSELKRKEALAAAAGGGHDKGGGGGGGEGSKLGRQKKTKHKIGRGKVKGKNAGGGGAVDDEDDDDEEGGDVVKPLRNTLAEQQKKGKTSMRSLFSSKKKGLGSGAEGERKSMAEAMRETMSSNIEFAYNDEDDDVVSGGGGGGTGSRTDRAPTIKMGSAQPSFQSHNNPLMQSRRRPSSAADKPSAAAAKLAGALGEDAAGTPEGGGGGSGFVYPLGRTASTLDLNWDGPEGGGGGGGALKSRLSAKASKSSSKKSSSKKASKMAADNFDDDGAL